MSLPPPPPLHTSAAGAARLLYHEMRVRLARVPESIAGEIYSDGCFRLSQDAFLFTTEGGVRFHYRRGEGVSADLPGAHSEDEFQLYLWGTVFGAVAWLNGFFPLHASAVEIGGRAVAFTAPSGGGKSTLAAALSEVGLPHVSDDTLPLAMIGRQIVAVPDRKPLKLWRGSIELTGLAADKAIDLLPGKFYARPRNKCDQALQLTDLVVLVRGDRISLAPIVGAAKLTELAEAMYRPFVPAGLADDGAHTQWMTILAAEIRFWRLERPFTPGDPAAFAAASGAIREALAAAGIA